MPLKENGYVVSRIVVDFLKLRKKFFKDGKEEDFRKLQELEECMTQKQLRNLQKIIIINSRIMID